METVQKLVRFLDESPTCYHAAANVKAALNAAGAVELRESKPWKLEKGTLYVVERGDSAVISFRVPESGFTGFCLRRPTVIRRPSRSGNARKFLLRGIPCGSAWSLTAAGSGGAGWTGPYLWLDGW